MRTNRARRRSRRYTPNPLETSTMVLVVAGAFAAAFMIRKLVQEPIDRSRGVTSP